jgi:predicted small secreted protein
MTMQFIRYLGVRLLGVAVLMGMLVQMGCETVEGAGKDIKHGGQAIERSAEDHK